MQPLAVPEDVFDHPGLFLGEKTVKFNGAHDCDGGEVRVVDEVSDASREPARAVGLAWVSVAPVEVFVEHPAAVWKESAARERDGVPDCGEWVLPLDGVGGGGTRHGLVENPTHDLGQHRESNA